VQCFSCSMNGRSRFLNTLQALPCDATSSMTYISVSSQRRQTNRRKRCLVNIWLPVIACVVWTVWKYRVFLTKHTAATSETVPTSSSRWDEGVPVGEDQSNCAIVSYISSEDYLECASTLVFSIRKYSNKYATYIALTDDMDINTRTHITEVLREEGIPVLLIQNFQNPNENVPIAAFRNNYAVLNLWNLTQFSRVVAIDADMVAVGAVDELCEMGLETGHVAAANNWWTSKKAWDDNVFNGGLLVLTPNATVFATLVSDAKTYSSASGGVQPFLNDFFREKRVFLDAKVWGMNANAFDLRRETWNSNKIILIHFTTKAKPCHTSGGEFFLESKEHPYVVWHRIYRERWRAIGESKRLLWKGGLTTSKNEMSGCILYLLSKESGPTGKDYVDLLKRSLQSVEKFFFSVARYAVCIIHTKDIEGSILRSIADLTESNVYTYQIEFRFPLHKMREYTKHTPTAPTCISKFNPNKVWHINYLHMCHFYTTEIFHHPVFHDFQWILRLDADSGFDDFIPCDPFELLERKNKVFGYYKKERQGGGCADGFHEKVVSEFVNKTRTRLKHQVQRLDVYLGAFHIFKTSVFTSTALLRFWDWIEYIAVAYENRTGEQAVVPYALAMVAELGELHNFAGYSLWHRHEKNTLWPERRTLPTGC